MKRTFGNTLRDLRRRHGLTQEELAERSGFTAGYISDLELGKRAPSHRLARQLGSVLDAEEDLVRATDEVLTVVSDDELDAYELCSRVATSNLGEVALLGLEAGVDELAIAYQGSPPAALLPEARRYLSFVMRFMEKSATLAQRRRLIVAGGWLSLVAATLNIDLRNRAGAAAQLAAARALAESADEYELLGWYFETRAWDALTEGQYRLAIDLAQAGQRAAPSGGSAIIQATAQEGRAWARLGERSETFAALGRVAHLASPLARPEMPEHHYRYDPAKRLAYTATTLTWVGDPAAEGVAREVLSRLESGVDGGQRPRRVASAHLDLGLALVAAGWHDEAAGEAMTAIESGRLVPSNAWRAAEIVSAVERASLPEAADLREAYENLHIQAVTHP